MKVGLTVDDLKPKPFKINVKGVELESKPLTLSQAITMSKAGSVLNDPKNATKQQMKEVETELNETIRELIPEINFDLSMDVMVDVLNQLMNHIEPSDNKELADKGVKINSDPKETKARTG